MNDTSQALEAETPVNPYSLLEAVNRSSDSANAAWLIFLGLMAYLLLTVAGVSHRDLLLNTDISLPILQVKIDLTRFFLFAPILLVLLHMGLIGQLVLLARKTLEFAASLRMLETSELRNHPLRLEVDNFFFVQSIAGPERSRVVSAFLYAMSWLTLILLPVALLLYVQIVFLPYHDTFITNVHRLAVLADVALLMFIGIFLMRSETSVFSAFWRTGASNPGSLFFAACVLAGAAFLSLAVATVPPAGAAADRPAFIAADGSLFGIFRRNLDVADTDLVVDKDVTPGEPSLNLRGRDLRFAKLDRVDLHQADMTGANLDGASLTGADLRGVWMQCGDLNEMILADDRRAGRCASARGASFARARLTDAKLSGIDLTGARFDDARLDGAVLAHSAMAGATFANAQMERADLSGGSLLQGANFLLAQIQGADLSGAKLQLADFTGAGMQAANLSLAGLEGAVLRNAELDGASLQWARLAGADLTGARLAGADLSGAVVWATRPPAGDAVQLADMGRIVLRAPNEEDVAGMKAAIAGAEAGALRTRLADGLAPLLDPRNMQGWDTAADGSAWASLMRAADTGAPDTYKLRLTDHLTRLMCRARFSGGAVAAGVARRAMAQGFKGDMPALYDQLKSPSCLAGAAMSQRLMREFAAAADAAREAARHVAADGVRETISDAARPQ